MTDAAAAGFLPEYIYSHPPTVWPQGWRSLNAGIASPPRDAVSIPSFGIVEHASETNFSPAGIPSVTFTLDGSTDRSARKRYHRHDLVVGSPFGLQSLGGGGTAAGSPFVNYNFDRFGSGALGVAVPPPFKAGNATSTLYTFVLNEGTGVAYNEPRAETENLWFQISIASAASAIPPTSKVALETSAELKKLASEYPALSSHFCEALKFAASIPWNIVRTPRVWSDGESEVGIEWMHGQLHAFVSFDGEPEFGYAMRVGDRFIPGNYVGIAEAGVPPDLLSYLSVL